MVGDSISVNVDLTRRAKAEFKKLCGTHGMTQKAAVERIVMWVAEQDPLVQAVALGHIPPEFQGDVLSLIQKRLRRKRSATEVETAAAQSHNNRQHRPAS